MNTDMIVPKVKTTQPQAHKAAFKVVQDVPVADTPEHVLLEGPISLDFSAQLPRKHRHLHISTVLTFFVVLFFIASGVFGVNYLRAHKIVGQQMNHVQTLISQQANVAANAEPIPSEDKTSVIDYHAAADMPKYLSMPSIGVLPARIRSLGVDAKNALLAPTNIYDAGMYETSAKPGDSTGVIVVDGFVSGPTKPGVFNKLSSLKIGDIVTITQGDDSKVSFKVVHIESIAASEMDMSYLLKSADVNKLGLNLVTAQSDMRTLVFTVKQ